MIDVYYWPTPNGYKVTIMLEECGIPYNIIPINIGKGEQFSPDFLKISPNNRMPAIVDHDGPEGKPISIFESGAILLYLAEKTGKFIPENLRGRYEVIEWLMFQMAGVGPMIGQAHHFRAYAPEKISYAIDRYTNEAGRLYGVIDRRLSDRQYLAGDYSIADMALFGWTRDLAKESDFLAPYANVQDWFERLLSRAAVQRGLAVLAETRKAPSEFDDQARAMMFGEAVDAKEKGKT